MSLSQTCPRRMGGIGPWEYKEDLDKWEHRTQLSNGIKALHCSFCGSLHPEEFMRGVREQEYEVGPTDKNYKAYVQGKGDGKCHVCWGSGGDTRLSALVEACLEEGIELPEEAKDRKCWHCGGSGEAYSGPSTKFYYQHLTPEQQEEFVRLYNDSTMKIGYPGHFYRLPFFMRLTNAV